MNDLTSQKLSRKNKKKDTECPKTVLDIIRTDYPGRYEEMLNDFTMKGKLFSRKEWIDILTKSRNSYESRIKKMKGRKAFKSSGKLEAADSD
ncbi:MAG: hypothetical protein QHH06_13895 [Clostridiales bacterium]|nr:hypothetical protein [Eubacteriales bacterium]MDH7567535.1 hypothetical protein [Clostridiales bacterium]